MRKNLKFSAAAIAALMSVAFITGCSQESSAKPIISMANTTKAEIADGESKNTTVTETEVNVADTSFEETAATEVTATTEAGSQPAADDRYAYYDLLNEEYEKSGAIYYIDLQDNYSIIGEDKIVVYYDTYSRRIYDVKKKEFSQIYNLNWHGITFADVDDGYIYGDSYGVTIKYDLQGNIVNQIDAFGKILADGTLVCSEGDVHFMYLPDWQTKVEFPELAMGASHGMKEYITNYHVIARYNNKVYAYVKYSEQEYNEKDGLYCLDTDARVWTKIANNKKDIGDYRNAKIIGRYALWRTVIFRYVQKVSI